MTAAVSTQIAVRYFREAWGNLRKGEISSAVWKILAVSGTFSTFVVIVNWATRYHLNFSNWDYWKSLGVLIAAGFYASGLWDALSIATKEKTTPSESPLPNPTKIVHDSIGYLAFLVVMIGAYTTVTYPHLWAAIGGGEKENVMLLATEEGERVAKKMGLEVRNDGEIGPLPLLTSSQFEVVVLNRDASGTYWAVRMNRTLFTSLASVYRKD